MNEVAQNNILKKAVIYSLCISVLLLIVKRLLAFKITHEKEINDYYMYIFQIFYTAFVSILLFTAIKYSWIPINRNPEKITDIRRYNKPTYYALIAPLMVSIFSLIFALFRTYFIISIVLGILLLCASLALTDLMFL